MPEDVRERIVVAYRAMGPNVNVAVRSSATGEDGADASFAGMNATFTNISGEPELIDAVQRCWASLFGARVVSYRASRGFSADPAMAVVVQQMIASERSGVAFTADPTTDATDRVVVEGAFGQGEVVVSGSVEPDTYVVSKETGEIISRRIGYKSFKIVRGADGTDQTVQLSEAEADSQVLNDDEVRTIADIAVRSERHAGSPQDTEWAIAGGKTWIVQTRPITTLHRVGKPVPETHEVLLQGLPAVPGEASGVVRVLVDVADGGAPAGRRGAGGPDDQPGLAAHHAPGVGAGDRHRRHDLPRRHRRPRARGALHRRCPHRHQGPQGRHRGHGGRHPRPGAGRPGPERQRRGSPDRTGCRCRGGRPR